MNTLRKHAYSNILKISPQKLKKKGKRKVQGVPQSQTAALPRPQEEEETDKSESFQTKNSDIFHNYVKT